MRNADFKSLVMPFGLTNVLASFQHFMNDVLQPFIDIFASAYLDNILISSETLKEHRKHVRQVLQALLEAGLHLAPEKCEFHQESIKYLGLIITTGGVALDPAKISTVCVCVIFYFYTATCGPKGHGSGLLLPSQAAAGLLNFTYFLTQIGIFNHSRVPLSPTTLISP